MFKVWLFLLVPLLGLFCTSAGHGSWGHSLRALVTTLARRRARKPTTSGSWAEEGGCGARRLRREATRGFPCCWKSLAWLPPWLLVSRCVNPLAEVFSTPGFPGHCARPGWDGSSLPLPLASISKQVKESPFCCQPRT